MKPSPHPGTLATLNDPRFWEMVLPLFCNEDRIREFSEISNVPVEYIKAARRKYLDAVTKERFSPYSIPGNNTIN